MTMCHHMRQGTRALLASTATALLVLAVATGAPAHAGPPDRESDDSLQAAAAVGDVSRTPFQQYHFTHCNADEICTVDFRRVPSGARLEITNVSCYLEVSARTGTPELRVAQLLLLRPNASIATASTLLLGQQHTSLTATGNLRGYAANHAVDVFAPAGHYFQAYADPSGRSIV